MDIIESILGVFSGITTWFTDSLQSVVSLFYAVPAGGTDAELTFLGATAVAGLGISVVLLVINLVKSFIRFK